MNKIQQCESPAKPEVDSTGIKEFPQKIFLVRKTVPIHELQHGVGDSSSRDVPLNTLDVVESIEHRRRNEARVFPVNDSADSPLGYQNVAGAKVAMYDAQPGA